MKAVVPEIDLPFRFRGIELRPDDTEEAWRGKLARITLDERFQLSAVLNASGILLEYGSDLLERDAIGLPFWDAVSSLVKPNASAQLRDHILRVASQGEAYRYDLELHEPTLMDLALTPVKDTRGVVVLLVLEGRIVGRELLIDVCGTQLFRGDSRERYRQKIARITLDSMVQFVGLLDARGTVLEINHIALDAVGINLADVEGRPFWTTFWWQVSQEINATLRESILRAAQGEFVRWDAEIYGRAGGKETIIIDASLMPVKDEQGNVVFITAEGRDITEKKAQEREIARQREELAELDQLKTKFFANISHEFRTPLTLMMGPLEDAIAQAGDLSEQNRDRLELAHRNSLRLLKLVNTLLDFSRIEAGRIQASYESVDLAALTAELASVFRSAAERAGLKFTIDCPQLPEAVYVDREMWEKIVLNLISNAFKFTFEGEITVSLRVVDGAAELTVRDTGTGIPAEEIPRLFDRFHRVKGARGRSYEGSGIGLALVQELVKLHGGDVRVASEPGRGSSFIVSIPCGRAHLPAGRIEAGRSQASTGLRTDAYVEEILRWAPDAPYAEGTTTDNKIAGAAMQRILLADDNADMRGYVQRLLTQAGYEVDAVADGLAALSAARARPPDLVLSDVMMPGLDGFGLLRELRADGTLGGAPVILLSARAGEEARIEGLHAGADDYLIKPFSARELLARVESHLKMARFRHDTAETVRLRTAQFETLLNKAPLGVFLVDAGFRIREVNPVALPVFGEIPGGVLGRDLDEIIHIVWEKPSADEIVRLFRHTQETGESYYTPEWAEYRADRGVKEYYEWRLDRIPLANGQFGVVCYFRDISARVIAREELARSEERFRAFVTASSDVVYRMSPDWKEMLYLQGGRDFVAATESPSKDWVEKYIHPEDRERVLAAIQKAIAAKSAFELEHRVVRADGSLGWTLSRAIPLQDAHGNIVEWFGAAADVTEHKWAEQSVARLTAHSEQQRRLYRTILSSTPDLVYVFDLNHRFTYANEALLTMWGKTAEEALGKNCLELGYEPWHAAMHDREIEAVIATKRPIRGDVPFTGTHGRRIYDYIFVPVLDANGEVEAIAGTTRDVTERNLAEERLRFMAESMPQKIFTAGADGEMDYFNRQWMDFTGLNLEQLHGSNWTRAIHPDDATESLQSWRHSVESGEPFQSIHRFRRSDGAYRWHLSRIHAMPAGDGRVMMWIGSSTEIHEQKHTEEELRRANQDLEQFAYAASHDLQEPLRGIKIYSELLARGYESALDAQGLQFLQQVKNGAARMEMLVRDLLAYTQVAQLDKPTVPVDAGAALSVALDNLSGAIHESGARITSDPLPSLYIHPTHLQQLFQNLVGNAVKYHRPGTVPAVHVTARRDGARWIFTVADNGIGIETKYREGIFGLFKRLHTNDQYSGTGIGLALCQRIVERNQGTIWVDSEAGQGSEFHFALPA